MKIAKTKLATPKTLVALAALALLCALSKSLQTPRRTDQQLPGAANLKRMMKKIFLVFAITLSATSVIAQSESDRPLITVSGQAEMMAEGCLTSSEISRNIADNQGTIAPGLISITVRVKVSFELN